MIGIWGIKVLVRERWGFLARISTSDENCLYGNISRAQGDIWQNVTGWQLLSWNSPRHWGTVLHCTASYSSLLFRVCSMLMRTHANPLITRAGVLFIISCQILNILTTVQSDVILGSGNCPLHSPARLWLIKYRTCWGEWLILSRYLPMYRMMDRLRLRSGTGTGCHVSQGYGLIHSLLSSDTL